MRLELIAAVLLLAPTARAQSSYYEDFENAGIVAGGQHGPAGLVNAGWAFRNQSAPTSIGDWRRWSPAYQGSWSLYVDTTVGWWQAGTSEASSWALLPAISGQAAGDELRFFFRNNTTIATPTAQLEIRYSPSGGTSTGSSAQDVGDFTTLLLNILDQEVPWTEVNIDVPGSGRLAFRFHIPPTSSQPSFFGDFSIDELSVTRPPSTPPLPGPGQTVTWSAAISPFSIDQLTTIPVGGTVLVEPGVVVTFEGNTQLWVRGDLIATGTPAQRVRFLGSGRILAPGTLVLDHADVDVLVGPDDGGSLSFFDVSFQSTGGALTTVTSPTYLWSTPPFVQLDGCTFDGSYVRVGDSTVLVRNTSLVNSYCDIGGYLLLEDVSIDGSPFDGLYLLDYAQPVYLDDISITNSTGSALNVRATNVLVGGNVALSGNQYPVTLGGGGFLEGTTLPAAGNAVDKINVLDAQSAVAAGSIWSDVGIPYAVQGSYSGGAMEILPGTHIQLAPGASIWGPSQPVNIRGHPANPVLIERLNPAQPWQGLQYLSRIENAIIDGGDIGARFHSTGGSPGYIDNCVIRNCDYGTQNWAITRKTQFLNNGTGSWNNYWTTALDGATGGNSFMGNGLAVDSNGKLVDAENNWWGDPSGPTHPANPGGQGQTALSGADVLPFLTAPPDFTNAPPIVHLNRHDWLFEAGEKVILTWRVEDDDTIVSQRVEFVHPLNATQIIAAQLPGDARAVEWTVPDIGFSCSTPTIRVVATDSAGQEGWDASEHQIPSGEVQGELTLTSNLRGPYLAGQEGGSLCWSVTGGSAYGFSVDAALRFDADAFSKGLGGVTSFLSCLSGTIDFPFISTDTARVRVSISDGSCNHVKYFYSSYFEIRPDVRLGDAPPSVQLLSPQGGELFSSGSVIPITWTASDDEALRGFHVQASYDGGRTWHFLVEDLPASATGWGFQLPPSSGIADVRVRVIAVDRRFQNSSDGSDVSFSIIAGGSGSAAYCSAKLNSQGCAPSVASTGTPSVSSAQPFTIDCTGVINNKSGLLFYGYAPATLPFQGGTKCVAAPTRRTPVLGSGGNPPPDDCSGIYSYDFNARIQSGADPSLVAGQDVYAQYWYRDPQSANTTGLSNALAFTIEP